MTPDLQTFCLPESITGSPLDIELAGEMIKAWRTDGILQVATGAVQDRRMHRAMEASKRFYRLSLAEKSRCISDLTYSGYYASGEEITAGEADSSEIFTVCKDVPLDDARVQERWPFHGPVPWPDEEYQTSMTEFMEGLGQIGERLLRLTALGMGLDDMNTLTDLTRDGWRHMRVLRFPSASRETARGVGAHTDYGLLVIVAQDDVGGLYIRPPVEGEERKRNWLPTESSAGMYEDVEPWTFVKPAPSVLIVFPGDILQFMTDGYLLSTPHKIRLNTRERFSLAYFHEPHFGAVVRPLSGQADRGCINYGAYITNMFMRAYPDRTTTRRIIDEDRLSKLPRPHESGSVVAA
jgi:2-oxoglutarate dioxygenase / 2-oxoglutarate/L-arginine monooxygenase/decarboxylase